MDTRGLEWLGELERKWLGPRLGAVSAGRGMGCVGATTLGARGPLPPSPRPLLSCMPPVHSKWRIPPCQPGPLTIPSLNHHTTLESLNLISRALRVFSLNRTKVKPQSPNPVNAVQLSMSLSACMSHTHSITEDIWLCLQRSTCHVHLPTHLHAELT